MTADERARVDARFGEVLAANGLADSRDEFRRRLRELKARNPESYRRAAQYYESEVAQKLVGESGALAAWIEYGRVLCALSGESRTVAIDATGRARPFSGEYEAGTLVLVIPEDTREEPLASAVPLEPSAAQRATLDLLVHRRLALANA